MEGLGAKRVLSSVVLTVLFGISSLAIAANPKSPHFIQETVDGDDFVTNSGGEDRARTEGIPKFSDWSAPVNLGAIVNSTSNDQHPGISPDNLSLYFASDRSRGQGGLDLWVTQRSSVNEPWGRPQNLGPNINSSFKENAPTLSIDGHFLFFGSDRPGPCGHFDIWMSHRKNRHDDFSWEAPVDLGCTLNGSTDDDGPTFYVDKESDVTTLYFTSFNRPGNIGDWDIYSATLNEDGTFDTPQLVPELSSPFRDTRTAIRRDGLEIFLTSNRPLGRDLDIWVSTRKCTRDPWSTPENLGPVVNSAGSSDGAPTLSRDGTTLYFYSNRPGGLGLNDLYVTTRTKLPH
jgi:Tol biopolymer transport system component